MPFKGALLCQCSKALAGNMEGGEERGEREFGDVGAEVLWVNPLDF